MQVIDGIIGVGGEYCGSEEEEFLDCWKVVVVDWG